MRLSTLANTQEHQERNEENTSGKGLFRDDRHGIRVATRHPTIRNNEMLLRVVMRSFIS